MSGCFDKINPQHADELFKFDSVMYEEKEMQERARDTVSTGGKPLPLTEPPVKPITIHTPPALELHVKRENQSGCLHYCGEAAVKSAAVQRWR